MSMTGSEEDDESLQVIVAHTGQPTQGDQARERDGRGLPTPKTMHNTLKRPSTQTPHT